MSRKEESAAPPPMMSLADMINNATRAQHTALNKLIMSRLPLGLQPHTPQPDLYLMGMIQVAEIFFAFESLWDEITSTSHMSSLDNSAYGTVDAYPHPREDVLIAGLRKLRPMGLARSGRLQDDLMKLEHRCNVAHMEHMRSDIVESIVARMDTEVRARPHLLIAYAFMLYLAVLSGGRHIRHELCKQGLEFWSGVAVQEQAATAAPAEKKSYWNWRSPVGRLGTSQKKEEDETTVPDHKTRIPKTGSQLAVAGFESQGLSFWFFPGPNDGEDLRIKFKQNLAELSNYISPSQEDEIVAETQILMSRIASLVAELDGAVAASRALGASTIAPSTEKEVVDEALEDVRVEKSSDTVAPAIALPVLRDRNGQPLPWFLGLGILMCGVSYAAMVYGYSWSS